MDNAVLLWVGFTMFIVAMLALDIGLFHRKAQVIGMREALGWTAVWITLALAFNVGVWYWLGSRTAMEFLTGYLVEKALSIDNVFVLILIFSYFETPAATTTRCCSGESLAPLSRAPSSSSAGAPGSRPLIGRRTFL